MRRPDHLPYWLSLLAVLVLAAILRMYSLPDRGLLYWDEGKFTLEGIRLFSVLQALPDVRAVGLAGKAIGTAKPTHALLIAVSYRLLGIRDYAPLLLDATASVLEVGVTFLVARQLFGLRVSLLAAALLAVSGYDIIYARSALSESDADVLFLLGVLIWMWSVTRDRHRLARMSLCWVPCLWAGVLMGAAFTTNYRLIVYIATLVGIATFETWRRAGWQAATVAGSGWIAGLALFPALWQVVGMVTAAHGVILFRSEITGLPTSYLEAVLYQIHGGKQSILQFSPLPYLEWYVFRQGWPASILLAVGLIHATVERSYRWVLPAAMVLVPYVVYMFAPFIVPRNLDAALPFTAILSAATLASMVERFNSPEIRRWSFALASLLLVLAGSIIAWPLTDIRSGFSLAAHFVKGHGSQGALVVNEVMLFYLRDPGRGCDAPRLPVNAAALAGDGLGADYAVIDQYSSPLARYLAHHAHLVARYPTISTTSATEDLIASENGVPPFIHWTEQVDVYALDSLHLRERGVMAPRRCTLDSLA